MDDSIGIETMIRIVYSLFLVYFITKIVMWLYGYIKQVIVLSKIYSPRTMIPLIGNALDMDPGAGIFQLIENI
jgi:hypothetical protein